MINCLSHIKKMKIQIVSDIHFDTRNPTNSFSKFVSPSGDILCLAGDIGSPILDRKTYTYFLKFCSDNFKYVLLVPGNHEYYGDYKMSDVIKALQNIVGLFSNVILLDNSVFEIEDYVFIGSTLWSYIPPDKEGIVKKKVMSFRVIPEMTIKKSNELFNKNYMFILENIKKYTGKKICVITHHAPVMEGTLEDYYIDSKSQLNCAYANNLNSLVNKCDLWICGHTHRCNTFKVGKCAVILNCYGHEETFEHLFSNRLYYEDGKVFN